MPAHPQLRVERSPSPSLRHQERPPISLRHQERGLCTGRFRGLAPRLTKRCHAGKVRLATRRVLQAERAPQQQTWPTWKRGRHGTWPTRDGPFPGGNGPAFTTDYANAPGGFGQRQEPYPGAYGLVSATHCAGKLEGSSRWHERHSSGEGVLETLVGVANTSGGPDDRQAGGNTAGPKQPLAALTRAQGERLAWTRWNHSSLTARITR